MHDMNRLYNEDCLLAMRQMPDNYFELALVDPPYGGGGIPRMGGKGEVEVWGFV